MPPLMSKPDRREIHKLGLAPRSFPFTAIPTKDMVFRPGAKKKKSFLVVPPVA